MSNSNAFPDTDGIKNPLAAVPYRNVGKFPQRLDCKQNEPVTGSAATNPGRRATTGLWEK
jgi:hypothetical protein